MGAILRYPHIEAVADECEVIRAITPPRWGRLSRGLLTLSVLRKSWGQLGQYLRDVKQLGDLLEALNDAVPLGTLPNGVLLYCLNLRNASLQSD